MRAIFDPTGHVARWAADRIWSPEHRGFGPCKAMAVVEGDRILGVMVYHNWVPEHGIIELSGASDTPRWTCRRDVITEIFGYPFSFCQMIVMQQDMTSPARRIWRRFGCDEVVIPRLRGRHADGSLMTLTDDQWKRHPMNLRGADGQA